MNRTEMMELVDRICEEEGYENAPAYDLIYKECCDGRSNADAKEMIKELLREWN